MRKPRKNYTPPEKVAILRRHLIDRVPVSDLCDEYQLSPTLFYAWQKLFFENGASAFVRKNGSAEQSHCRSRPGREPFLRAKAGQLSSCGIRIDFGNADARVSVAAEREPLSPAKVSQLSGRRISIVHWHATISAAEARLAQRGR